MPAAQLNALSQNPEALVSSGAQAQLQTQLAQLGPTGNGIYNQLIIALKGALSVGLNEVFLIGFFIIIAALVVHLFIKEIPLRKTHAHADDTIKPVVENVK